MFSYAGIEGPVTLPSPALPIGMAVCVGYAASAVTIAVEGAAGTGDFGA